MGSRPLGPEGRLGLGPKGIPWVNLRGKFHLGNATNWTAGQREGAIIFHSNWLGGNHGVLGQGLRVHPWGRALRGLGGVFSPGKAVLLGGGWRHFPQVDPFLVEFLGRVPKVALGLAFGTQGENFGTLVPLWVFPRGGALAKEKSAVN